MRPVDLKNDDDLDLLERQIDETLKEFGLDRLGQPHLVGIGLMNGILRHGRDASLTAAEIARSLNFLFGPGLGEAGETAVSISVSSHWDPVVETWAEAKARLIEEFTLKLGTRMEGIAVALEGQGFVFRDTQPRYELHVGWLFDRVRHGSSWIEILDDTPNEAFPDGEAVTPGAVEKAVRKLAGEASIDVSSRES